MEHCRSRWISSSSGWLSFRPTARSWLTAAARSASTRTKPSAACKRPGARRAAWRGAGPNGGSRPSPRNATEPHKEQRGAGYMNAAVWMRSNLTTQGYCLSDTERRELWLALRFSTGLCLTLVVVALALGSPVMVFGLAGIGAIAGFSARHPFDHLWNHGVRHLVGG